MLIPSLHLDSDDFALDGNAVRVHFCGIMLSYFGDARKFVGHFLKRLLDLLLCRGGWHDGHQDDGCDDNTLCFHK